MSEYTVRTEALANASSNLKSISQRISEIASETGTVLRNTRRTGAEAITRLAKDTIMVGSVRLCSEEMKTLATLLETVAELYHTSERYVIEKDFKAAQEYAKGFSDDGFADFSQFDMTEIYLEGRNDTLDAILFALTRPLTDGIKSAFNKLIGGDDFNDEVFKKTILRMLANSDSKKYDLSGLKDVIKFTKNTAGAQINLTDDLLEALGEESDLSELIGGMGGEVIGNLSDILSAGETGVDIVELCINDYAKTISSLEAMKEGLQAVGGDQRTINYIDEIIADYNNKFATSVEMVNKTIVDFGVDEGLDLATDAATCGLFSIADTLHGGIWNAFDLPDKGESLAGVYVSAKYSDDLIASYNYYAEKLQSGNYTQNDVDMCKSMFEMARAAKIDEYTCIKANVGREDREFLDAEIEKLRNLQWNSGAMS